MPLDATGVARAVALADAGYSQRRIARTLGVPRTTIRDAIRRFRETGSYTRRPGQGRQRCTSARDDRFVVGNVLRNRFSTATEARTRFFEVQNVSVSERTIRRRLAERNLRAFRPARAPEYNGNSGLPGRVHNGLGRYLLRGPYRSCSVRQRQYKCSKIRGRSSPRTCHTVRTIYW